MSGLEIPLLIAGIAGTGLEVGGRISAAQSEAEAGRQRLALKRVEADELLSRQGINEQILRERSEEIQSQYVGAFASTGKRGGGLGGVLRIKKDLEFNILNSRREAEFKARMIRAGADIEEGLISDSLTASYIGAAGSILTGGVRTYYNFRGPTPPVELDLDGSYQKALSGYSNSVFGGGSYPALSFNRSGGNWSL